MALNFNEVFSSFNIFSPKGSPLLTHAKKIFGDVRGSLNHEQITSLFSLIDKYASEDNKVYFKDVFNSKLHPVIHIISPEALVQRFETANAARAMAKQKATYKQSSSLQNPVEIYLKNFHSLRALNSGKSERVIHEVAIARVSSYDAKYIKKYWRIYGDIAAVNPTATENQVHASALNTFKNYSDPLFCALKKKHPSLPEITLEEWRRNITSLFTFS